MALSRLASRTACLKVAVLRASLMRSPMRPRISASIRSIFWRSDSRLMPASPTPSGPFVRRASTQVLHKTAKGEDPADGFGELRRRQSLVSVAQGGPGIVVDLDDQAVGAAGHGGEAHRRDETGPARAMGRVDDHRQMGQLFDGRDRA